MSTIREQYNAAESAAWHAYNARLAAADAAFTEAFRNAERTHGNPPLNPVAFTAEVKVAQDRLDQARQASEGKRQAAITTARDVARAAGELV